MRNHTLPGQPLSEQDFLAQVTDLARLTGWRVHHCRPAITRSGRWATPIHGHAGFPDLILAHPQRGLLAVELKSARGRLSGEQQAWLDVLRAAGVDARVWRPGDWAEIERALTGTTHTGHRAEGATPHE